ncbi:MAG: acyl-CoA dehydrogenase family protein [Desulfobacterales bacterium]|nr:acyl-CoA dehydrogenase family protein [Desulfobacterales bacterium]
MNFDLSSEQNILKESAHKLLAHHCTSDMVREMAGSGKGVSSKLWNTMADLGWMSLLTPEAYGGSGVNPLDLALILYEMGYHCLASPFFATVVMGGAAVLEAGNEDQKQTILPLVADGKIKLSLAWLETAGTYAPEGIQLAAVKDNQGYVLTGTKLFVPDAAAADRIICAARTSDAKEGLSLFMVDATAPGVEMTRLDTLGDDRQYEVAFDHVRVPGSNLLGPLDRAWPILDKILLQASVAKSAEMCGGAYRVMDMVIPYAKGRKQFGKPIGAFQAIQHHCANMLTFAETMKYLAFQAAWRMTTGLPCAMEAAICKAWASDAYGKLVALGHQVVGGVGFMEEFDLQLFFRQAKAAELLFGDAVFHRERVAQAMDL